MEWISVNGTKVTPNISNSTVSYHHTQTPTEQFAEITGVWVTGFFCILGLIGNILSICVLGRAHAKSPMFYVLRAVAVSDTILLLAVFIIMTLVNLHNFISALDAVAQFTGYIQQTIWPILMMAQMTTVWLTVLVSGERYVAVCQPLKAASICTIPKVRRAVILVFVSSITFNIPRYFEFRTVDNGRYIDKTEVGNNLVYRYLYSCLLYSLFLFFFPLFALIFLNLKLIFALKQGKKQWKKLQFKQKKEQNLTVIPLTIVLIFFICGVPALGINIMDSIGGKLLEHDWFRIMLVIANLLVVINSACNFIIYCMLGKKFRTKLMELLHCRCSNYRAVYTMNYSISES